MKRYSTVYCDGASVIVQSWSHKPKYDVDIWEFYHPTHPSESYNATSRYVLDDNFELNTELNQLVNEAYRTFNKNGLGIKNFNIMVLSEFLTTKTRLKSVVVEFREFLVSKGLIEREIKSVELEIADLAPDTIQRPELSFEEVVESIKQGHPFTCDEWAGIGFVEFNPCSLDTENDLDVSVYFPCIVRNMLQNDLTKYLKDIKPTLCYIEGIDEHYLEEAEETIRKVLDEDVKLKDLDSKEFKDLFSRIMEELPLGSRESLNIFRTFYHLQFLY